MHVSAPIADLVTVSCPWFIGLVSCYSHCLTKAIHTPGSLLDSWGDPRLLIGPGRWIVLDNIAVFPTWWILSVSHVQVVVVCLVRGKLGQSMAGNRHVTGILCSDWLVLVTWLECWPGIGWCVSRDWNAGIVSHDRVTLWLGGCVIHLFDKKQGNSPIWKLPSFARCRPHILHTILPRTLYKGPALLKIWTSNSLKRSTDITSDWR